MVHKCTTETLSSFAGHAFLPQVTFLPTASKAQCLAQHEYEGTNHLDYLSTIVDITVETNIPTYEVELCYKVPQFCGS